MTAGEFSGSHSALRRLGRRTASLPVTVYPQQPRKVVETEVGVAVGSVDADGDLGEQCAQQFLAVPVGGAGRGEDDVEDGTQPEDLGLLLSGQRFGCLPLAGPLFATYLAALPSARRILERLYWVAA